MQPAAALANRVLEREAWARERLAAHAGQGFVLAVGPVATGFRIDSTGLIESAPLSMRVVAARRGSSPAARNAA